MALHESHSDMVRPGISLYGVYPNREFEPLLPLQPVLSLKSQVVFFKVVQKGAGVSYGHSWYAPADTRVVTIPLDTATDICGLYLIARRLLSVENDLLSLALSVWTN